MYCIYISLIFALGQFDQIRKQEKFLFKISEYAACQPNISRNVKCISKYSLCRAPQKQLLQLLVFSRALGMHFTKHIFS